MGYDTSFRGILSFTFEPSVRQINKLKTMLDQDVREHPEWEDKQGLTYINLKLTEDMMGLEWDGSEKSYDMVEKVNLILAQMHKVWPDFGLSGQLLAQGEEVMDIWALVMDDDGKRAKKQKLQVQGSLCTCPDCGHRFILKD